MKLLRYRQDITRLEAFSDGVFAFSATLLVVSLEVPGTFPELVAELKGFVAFAISFAALILIWTVHHAFFRRYAISDGLTVFLNASLLFVILFYVYPLKFVADGIAAMLFGITTDTKVATLDDLAQLFMLYSGGFVAVFSCVSLMYLHVHLRGETLLGLTPAQRSEAAFYARHYGIFVGMGLVSIGVAAMGWGVIFGLPGIIYAMLGPVCYLHSRTATFDAADAAGPALASDA